MTSEMRIKRQKERELDRLAKEMFGKEYNELMYEDAQHVEREYGRRILEEVRSH